MASVKDAALRVSEAAIVPPVPLVRVTLLSPVMVTIWLLVPETLKLAELTVPVQVNAAAQVRTEPVDTPTAAAEAPATIVPKSRSVVLVTVS